MLGQETVVVYNSVDAGTDEAFITVGANDSYLPSVLKLHLDNGCPGPNHVIVKTASETFCDVTLQPGENRMISFEGLVLTEGDDIVFDCDPTITAESPAQGSSLKLSLVGFHRTNATGAILTPGTGRLVPGPMPGGEGALD